MLLYQTLAFTKYGKIQKCHITSNEEFELSDGSYSVSNIPDCFEYIFQKWSKPENSSIKIFVNKV